MKKLALLALLVAATAALVAVVFSVGAKPRHPFYGLTRDAETAVERTRTSLTVRSRGVMWADCDRVRGGRFICSAKTRHDYAAPECQVGDDCASLWAEVYYYDDRYHVHIY